MYPESFLYLRNNISQCCDMPQKSPMNRHVTRLSIDELFERDANIKGTRGHTLRLKKKQSVMDVRRYFSQRMVNRWNSLDQETVDV